MTRRRRNPHSRSLLDTNPRAWMRLREWWAMQLPLPCARCGETVYPNDDWHLDHVGLPRWAGGDDSNVRPSHALCNMSHSNEHPPRQVALVLVDDAPKTTSRDW